MKYRQMSFRVTDETLATLAAQAKRAHRSMTSQIEFLIEQEELKCPTGQKE